MPPPRSVEEWAAKCNTYYLIGIRVEGKSWGHLRHGMCGGCALLYAAEQVAQARAEEREWWMKMFYDDFPCIAAGAPRGSCRHDSWRHCLEDAAAIRERK